RWQAAVNLADALRNDRNKSNSQLKHDSKLAGQLSKILASEIEAGSMAEKPVTLRIFLCRSLGEFEVPDGLPVLVRAATVQRSESELPVRRAAIEALALLSE